ARRAVDAGARRRREYRPRCAARRDQEHLAARRRGRGALTKPSGWRRAGELMTKTRAVRLRIPHSVHIILDHVSAKLAAPISGLPDIGILSDRVYPISAYG